MTSHSCSNHLLQGLSITLEFKKVDVLFFKPKDVLHCVLFSELSFLPDFHFSTVYLLRLDFRSLSDLFIFLAVSKEKIAIHYAICFRFLV